jgi:2-(1,2-epoxy-1,2-dihydrophenyl)acetyl-CoA isomerase
MPRTIGMAKSMGASLFAEKISAEQADKWGLIWEAVPDKHFEATWKARAAHLAQGPTVAYKNIKEAFRASLGNTLYEQLSLEAKLQKSCGSTRDFSEGVTAFMQKRSAKFEGR